MLKKIKEITILLKNKCKVISLNINEELKISILLNMLPVMKLECYWLQKYLKFFNKLTIPTDRLRKILNKKFPKKIKNYGMIIKKDSFKVFESIASYQKFIFGYAVSICIAGKAKKLIAGFDGHKKIPLNKEFNYVQTIKKELLN